MSRSPSSLLATVRSLAAAGLIAMAAGSAPAQAADTLNIGGTGSALGGIQRLADAFERQHPDIDIIVLPSLGSGGGIKALAAGKIALAVSARPLKPAETAVGLVEREYARSPLVFATRHDTAADGVTLAEVTRAYRGALATWPDGARLRLVMRPAAEADTMFLRTLSPEMDEAVDVAIKRDDLFVAINDQDNAKALETIRGSLGVISVGQMRAENRDLKALTFDGKAGTIDGGQRRNLPLCQASLPHDRARPVTGGRGIPRLPVLRRRRAPAERGRLSADRPGQLRA